ncbi:MAG: hypothetical protein D6698_16590 [Gammaproteobacteria bacterium]|nr:MAG: hypothetical protein D6698_16590 [Gammaproteobacteria bacterium]
MDLRKTLVSLVEVLSPRDFEGFADELAACAPAAIVQIVRQHAKAADGNSPDLSEWVDRTLAEWNEYLDSGCDPDNGEQANEWWRRKYSE